MVNTQQNHLADETSPYLLQHAGNPVDWRPWGDAALSLAQKENKPILLSIGYSACHWCHVMAHESFEDPATAKLMNELFVNVKVDREERPDLDKVYQLAQQLLTQHPGGWPLTVFLTPTDQVPFFAGTYFPPQPRHGLPAFSDLLKRVASFYDENEKEITEQKAAIIEAFQSMEPPALDASLSLSRKPLDKARSALEDEFDTQFGGFSGAPKFPHPTNMELLLRYWRDTAADDEPDVHALYMTAFTLKNMAAGGIYDQLGGGFCRYSVDAHWSIPHFEKMLYDNGPLLLLFAQIWQITGDEAFRNVTDETANWVLREMRAPDGGFYSTLDADSEGHEGKFYVWTPDQVSELLNSDEYAVVAPHYGLDNPPNFEESTWHFRIVRPVEGIAETVGATVADTSKILNAARQRLFAARESRVHPDRDEKILTSWNGLMIKGLAVAASVLERDDLADAAIQACVFIRKKLWHDNRLLAVHKDGRSRFPAYLDDYAYLLDGVLQLLQIRWDTDMLHFAIQLADVLLDQFEDKDNGGFFFTARDHEALLHRPKTLSDDATPSGNGVAAQALGRLGHLLGDVRYLEAAERTVKSSWAVMERYPHAHGTLLIALEEILEPVETVVIRGNEDSVDEWRHVATSTYTPRRLVFAIPDSEVNLPGILAERKPGDEHIAYVCQGTQCLAPVTKLEDLARVLRT